MDALTTWTDGTHAACGLTHDAHTACSQAFDAIGYSTGGHR